MTAGRLTSIAFIPEFGSTFLALFEGDLVEADLVEADLVEADLVEADLVEADLVEADLVADLRFSTPDCAEIAGVVGISIRQKVAIHVTPNSLQIYFFFAELTMLIHSWFVRIAANSSHINRANH